MTELAPTPEALASAYEIFYGRPARPDELETTTSDFQRYVMAPVIERAHIIDRYMPQVDPQFRRGS